MIYRLHISCPHGVRPENGVLRCALCAMDDDIAGAKNG